MSFLSNCTNKGCYKLTEPVLDKATRKVYCVECGGEMTGITDFAKRSLETLGQIRREGMKREAFSVECEGCKRIGVPVLQKNGTLACPHCKGSHMKIPAITARAIVQHLTGKVS